MNAYPNALHRAFHQGSLKSFKFCLIGKPMSASVSLTSERERADTARSDRHVKFLQPAPEAVEGKKVQRSRLTTDVNATDSFGLTVLMKCPFYSDQESVPFARLLLKNNVNVNKIEPFTRLNAFQMAVLFKRYGLAEQMMEAEDLGLDLLAQDSHGNTVFHNLCHLLQLNDDQMLWKLAKSMFERVRKWKIRIEVENEKGMTPLHLAAAYGDVRLARCLVAVGCSPGRSDSVRHMNAYSWLEEALGKPTSELLQKDPLRISLDFEDDKDDVVIVNSVYDEKRRERAIDFSKLAMRCRAFCESDATIPRRYRHAPNPIVGLLTEALDALNVTPQKSEAKVVRGIPVCGNATEVQRTFNLSEALHASSFRKSAVPPKPVEEENPEGSDANNESDGLERSSSSLLSLRTPTSLIRKTSHVIMAAKSMRRHLAIPEN